jgi:hypothetical protein
LHARTEFDNISRAKLAELRQWVLNEGTAFHGRVRERLSKFDCDLNPDLEDGGGKIVVGAFSFGEKHEKQDKK